MKKYFNHLIKLLSNRDSGNNITNSPSTNSTNKTKELFNIISLPENELNKRKIGKLVKATLPLILSENLITESEIINLQKEDYCKITLDMNYPILKKVDNKLSIIENRTVNDHTRYYAGVFKNNGEEYLISSEWYERNLEDYIKWLKRRVKKF